MNDNINLCEILKGHEGETFYSPMYGEVKLIGTDSFIFPGNSNYPIIISGINGQNISNLCPNGHFLNEDRGECILFPSKNQRDWNKWVEENKKTFDGRHFSNEAINWKDIKVGDVVLEGNTNFNYRTITNITGNNWEYVDNNGYYHETKSYYCHWKVCGQKGCNGKLIKISIGEEQKPKTPKTWSDIVNQNKTKDSKVEIGTTFGYYVYDSTSSNTPIEKSALALLKINQLIEVGYGGNAIKTPDNNTICIIYDFHTNMFMVNVCSSLWRSHIIFHTKEQAEEFLKYPENVQLLKDYFMI